MNNQSNWFVGISDGDAHEYKIGNVTFTVFSEFAPAQDEMTIKDRFERSLQSSFTDLTAELLPNKMAEENVCSAAGKED